MISLNSENAFHIAIFFPKQKQTVAYFHTWYERFLNGPLASRVQHLGK